MEHTELKFKGIVAGKAVGKALVLREPIGFYGDIDETGCIIAEGHPYAGECVSDRILIYPEAKGSSAGCMMLYLLARCGKKPAGIVNTRYLDSNLVEGAILADIPLLCYPERDPYKLISTGDILSIDGRTGLLKKIAQ
jgi:predicted aconitase with swiveling domain